MAALGWLVTSPGPASAWTATACAPLLVRALVGYRRLSPVLPRFTRVGIWETIWAAWFAAFAGAALRALDVR
jgi:hypothetical protein